MNVESGLAYVFATVIVLMIVAIAAYIGNEIIERFRMKGFLSIIVFLLLVTMFMIGASQ